MKIGIDIGGSHVAIGILDKQKEEITIKQKFEKILTNIENEKMKEVESFIVETINELKKEDKIREIGISIPGKIVNGVVEYSPNLKLQKYELEKILREKLEYTGSLKIRNDGKCAAIAEHFQGTLKKYKNGAFLCIGTGIGGAILNEDTIHEQGAEFGHMVIDINGKYCNCGRHGCFEKYASMRSFKEEYIKQMNKGELTSQEILEELLNNNLNENKDILIEGILDEYIENLGTGIANIMKILQPEVIVIGGSFVYFKEIFVDRLITYIVEKELPYKQISDINIQMATLQNDAGIIGSII